MSDALFTALVKYLQAFGLTSFTWSLGYVFIMWVILWFLRIETDCFGVCRPPVPLTL